MQIEFLEPTERTGTINLRNLLGLCQVRVDGRNIGEVVDLNRVFKGTATEPSEERMDQQAIGHLAGWLTRTTNHLVWPSEVKDAAIAALQRLQLTQERMGLDQPTPTTLAQGTYDPHPKPDGVWQAVTARKTEVRDGPALGCTILRQLPAEYAVEIVDLRRDWGMGRLRYSSALGEEWVRLADLKPEMTKITWCQHGTNTTTLTTTLPVCAGAPDENAVTPWSVPAEHTAICPAGVHTHPYADSPLIRWLRRGEKVMVEATKGAWARIQGQGEEAWVLGAQIVLATVARLDQGGPGGVGEQVQGAGVPERDVVLEVSVSGPAGSGKSTLIRTIRQALRSDGYGYQVYPPQIIGPPPANWRSDDRHNVAIYEINPHVHNVTDQGAKHTQRLV